jgi:aminopeptidase YwaD
MGPLRDSLPKECGNFHKVGGHTQRELIFAGRFVSPQSVAYLSGLGERGFHMDEVEMQKNTGYLIALLVILASLPLVTTAQQPEWTVKPAWVRAHEEFLASDVLAGRKSATRDEELAASYVASQFLGYGLTTAPGMSSHIQTAEIVSPVLDHHASLTAGSIVLAEGPDFDMLLTSGSGLKGTIASVPLEAVGKTKLQSSEIALVTNLTKGTAASQVFNLAVHMGAGVIVVERDEGVDRLVKRTGGVPRGPTYLKGTTPPQSTTFIAVSHLAMEKLLSIKTGEPIALNVRELPQEPKRTYNAVAFLPGTDSTAGTILLTAHLDHLGIGPAINSDSIYNGANDDASGTTAVLEFAHALAQGKTLKRSVLFVCYGSEEIGALGSKYFIAHSPIPIATIVANLEFEMIGVQDPKMPKNTLLFTGWERSNLGPALREHGALIGPDPYPDQQLFERSDNYSLAAIGIVAHTAASWGNPTYHRPSDDLEHLDFNFLTTSIQSFIEPIRWLANGDFLPSWNPGMQPVPRR